MTVSMSPPTSTPTGGAAAAALALTPESRFVGTWRLVSTEAMAADGTKGPIALLGGRGRAYLIYTPDRHVCAILMNPQRALWSSSMPSANEAKLALEGFYAYCGTFEVNAEDGYVTHHLEIASTPSLRFSA